MSSATSFALDRCGSLASKVLSGEPGRMALTLATVGRASTAVATEPVATLVRVGRVLRRATRVRDGLIVDRGRSRSV